MKNGYIKQLDQGYINIIQYTYKIQINKNNLFLLILK